MNDVIKGSDTVAEDNTGKSTSKTLFRKKKFLIEVIILDLATKTSWDVCGRQLFSNKFHDSVVNELSPDTRLISYPPL